MDMKLRVGQRLPLYYSFHRLIDRWVGLSYDIEVMLM